MPCVHLLTKLCKQTLVKGMYFNVVDNFNYIQENIVKLGWHILASHPFSMDETV